MSKKFLDVLDFVVDVPVGREPVVLQLTDPQIIDSSQQREEGQISGSALEYWAPDKKEERCFKYLREVIEETKPDLILLTGDQVYGRFDDNGSNLLALIDFMESFCIPWAPINGNHDPENNMGVDWQSKQYEEAKYCLFKQNQYYDGKVIMGNGNYTVGITQGGKLTRVFFMMDSNAYDYCDKIEVKNDHSTGWVGFCGGQEEWYTEKIEEIKAEWPKTKIAFAFHCQSHRFLKVFEKYGYTGEEIVDGVDTIIIDDHPNKSEGDFGFLHLFLSANESDVQEAINANVASGIICGHELFSINADEEIPQIRIAFDGDAVIFSDEAERIYREQGLQAFAEHEHANARKPLPEGPFAKLLKTISLIQQKFPEDAVPIRTALVTARNAPAHERVVRTLRAWNVRIDEVFFLGGIEKSEVLKAFGANIFFDDQPVHVEPASKLVPAARVPYKQN